MRIVDEQSDPYADDERALDRAADDGWPSAEPVHDETTLAGRARTAIALLQAVHDVGAGEVSRYDTIVALQDDSLSFEAQIRELIGMLQGMTAFAEFLLAQFERATGSDGEAFLASVAEQTEQYFPG